MNMQELNKSLHQAKRTESTLKVHEDYTALLVEEGLDKISASKKAYNMIINGLLNKEIKRNMNRHNKPRLEFREEREVLC
jgi:hypothetical protein